MRTQPRCQRHPPRCRKARASRLAGLWAFANADLARSSLPCRFPTQVIQRSVHSADFVRRALGQAMRVVFLVAALAFGESPVSSRCLAGETLCELTGGSLARGHIRDAVFAV